MRARAESDWGLVGLLILVVVGYLLWEYWEPITGTQPDHRARHGALWLPTADVARGDTLEGRVRIADGLRTAIAGVIVSGAGPDQATKGREESWGDTITWKLGEQEKNEDELEFRVRIPSDTPTSAPLHLKIRVEYVSAQMQALDFTNDWDATTFDLDVPVYSSTISVARRAGKVALAIASWFAVVIVVVASRRWYRRRDREPSDAWGFALIPYLVLGRVWFAHLLSEATRLHAWWFTLACVVAWFLTFWLAARLTKRDSRRRYHVIQTRVPTETADAYRGGSPVPHKTIEEVIDAWQCAGLAVDRTSDELVVTNLEGHRAAVRIPASGAFGAGETFEVRTEYQQLLLAMLPPAAALLGELRWQLAD